MENRNVYKGHRYVPKIMGVWDELKAYEGLSIVTWEGTSYTSKKRVPEGVEITNEEYWAVTGNYDAQVEQYRQDVRQVEERVDGKLKDTDERVDNKIADTNDRVDTKITEFEKNNAIIVRPTGGNDRELINQAIVKASESEQLNHVILDGVFQVGGTDGVVMQSDVVLEFTRGSRLELITSNKAIYIVIRCDSIENFEILNPWVIGDRDTNSVEGGEHGHGIELRNCTNWKMLNVRVDKTWGDGVNIKGFSKDFYIDKIVTNDCRRNGVVLASFGNGIIDYIEGNRIDGTPPYAALDVESNAVGELWDGVTIGKVVSNDCPGGVKFQPFGLDPKGTVDITIDTIEINNDNLADEDNHGYLMISGENHDLVKGKISIDRVYVRSNRSPVYIKRLHMGGLEVFINHVHVVAENTEFALYLEVQFEYRPHKNIGRVVINNLEVEGEYNYLMHIPNQNTDNPGEWEDAGLKIGHVVNKSNKPIYMLGRTFEMVDGLMNEVNIKDLTNYVDNDRFSYQFIATLYHNEGATELLRVRPTELFLRGVPITLEVREEQTLRFDFRSISDGNILPSSLNFVDGFQSSEVGSRITFIVPEDGNDIQITNMTGTWDSFE